MKKSYFLAALAVAMAMPLSAQVLTIRSMEKVSLPSGVRADQAMLSPDGSKVVLTDFDGALKLVDRTAGTVRTISRTGSMMDLAFNADGTAIVYREASADGAGLRHVALNTYSIATGMSRQIAAPARNLQAVAVEGNIATAITDGRATAAAVAGTRTGAPAAPTTAPVPSIDRGRLYLTVGGQRTLFSPLGTSGMSYMWPSISPDGERIVFFAAGYGTYTCRLDGSDLKALGWLYGPVWYDNNTIVAFDSEDDGQVTYSGRIIAARIDGSARQTLTPPSVVAVLPDTAPGRITFTTADTGELYILNVE